MFVYVPELQVFLMAEEGSGDNLLREDIENGYVDYVYIETYVYSGVHGDLTEYEGGMKMLTKPFVEVYGAEGTENFRKDLLIKDSLDIVFGKSDLTYIEILEKEE